MSEVEIGKAKSARVGYAFDDVAVIPTRRTRDPEDVSTAWTIDAFKFELPVVAAPMDSAMSPATAIALGKMGGLGVLDLEGFGLATRIQPSSWLRLQVPRMRTQPLYSRGFIQSQSSQS